MRIIVSGAGGLIGSALVPELRAAGHTVAPLVRARPGVPVPPGGVAWDPPAGVIDTAGLAGADAVVHLAGENIAGARWTPEFRARLRDSRVAGTRLLAGTLARLARPPAVLLCASATGIYGNRGDEVLTEDSAPGAGFLAELGRAWEHAADPARAAGLRVVHLRFGVVLTPTGGALAKMLPLFRLGLGGRLGSGRQWWPWLALADATGILHFALDQPDLRGPVNAVAPELVTNRDFTRTLARVLGRPAVLPVPAWSLRLAVGPLADDALLAGQRAEPRRLTAAGYRFAWPGLAAALRAGLAPAPDGSQSGATC